MIESYLPLYRKYRPQQFADLVGQQLVSQALSNAITQSHIVHAYLFCGPRGTGKTSSARILAKSLNCVQGPTVSPCQACPSCISITAGNALDVTEIDAASNNGVDDMRELLDRVQFSAMDGRYKIYIIDEVHMLSPAAFNALLKTLEEPPDKVIFIFATTEPHKVLPTIISRCQRFDFHRIEQAAIEARLIEIAQLESIHIEPEAVRLIARQVKGGMRDALSMLDQVAVFGLAKAGEAITPGDILTFLGQLDDDVLFNLTQSLVDRDAHALLNTLSVLLEEGTEPHQVISGLVNHLRALLILNTCKGQQPDMLSDTPADLLERMTQQSAAFAVEELSQMLQKLSTLTYQMKQQSNPAMWLEIGLLEILHRDQIFSLAELGQRLEQLEHQLLSGGAMPASARPHAAPSHTSMPKPAKKVVIAQKPAMASPPPPAMQPQAMQPQSVQPQAMSAPSQPAMDPSSATGDLGQLWQEVVTQIAHPPTRGLVKDHCHLASVGDPVVDVVFSSDIFFNLFQKSADKLGHLQNAFEKTLQRPVQVQIRVDKSFVQTSGGGGMTPQAVAVSSSLTQPTTSQPMPSQSVAPTPVQPNPPPAEQPPAEMLPLNVSPAPAMPPAMQPPSPHASVELPFQSKPVEMAPPILQQQMPSEPQPVQDTFMVAEPVSVAVGTAVLESPPQHETDIFQTPSVPPAEDVNMTMTQQPAAFASVPDHQAHDDVQEWEESKAFSKELLAAKPLDTL